MARIFNDSDTVLSIEAQEVLQQAAANIGDVEVIELQRTNIYESGEIFAVSFESGADEHGEREVLFSGQFDTDGNVIA